MEGPQNLYSEQLGRNRNVFIMQICKGIEDKCPESALVLIREEPIKGLIIRAMWKEDESNFNEQEMLSVNGMADLIGVKSIFSRDDFYKWARTQVEIDSAFDLFVNTYESLIDVYDEVKNDRD